VRREGSDGEPSVIVNVLVHRLGTGNGGADLRLPFEDCHRAAASGKRLSRGQSSRTSTNNRYIGNGQDCVSSSKTAFTIHEPPQIPI
jgi:hypothetical protein